MDSSILTSSTLIRDKRDWSQDKKLIKPQNINQLFNPIFRMKVSTGTGACFMAVCRGKLSEGIDFSGNLRTLTKLLKNILNFWA